jgi:hypothetical protein
MESEVFIYTLAEPDTGAVRYVGKTNDLRQRLFDHSCDSTTRKMNKRLSWIKSLKARGYLPKIEVLEVVGESDWEEAEKFWIESLRFLECDLVNSNGGGLGGFLPIRQVRNRISTASSSRKHRPETVAKIAAASKRLMQEPDRRAKFIASRNTWTEESRRKLASSKTGKPRDEATRKKLWAGCMLSRFQKGDNIAPEKVAAAREILGL